VNIGVGLGLHQSRGNAHGEGQQKALELYASHFVQLLRLASIGIPRKCERECLLADRAIRRDGQSLALTSPSLSKIVRIAATMFPPETVAGGQRSLIRFYSVM
jgi:hypothetical protein